LEGKTGKLLSRMDHLQSMHYGLGMDAIVDNSADGSNIRRQRHHSAVLLGMDVVSISAEIYRAGEKERFSLNKAEFEPQVGHKWAQIEAVDGGFVTVDYGYHAGIDPRGRPYAARGPTIWLIRPQGSVGK
jgi:hypothetical protein